MKFEIGGDPFGDYDDPINMLSLGHMPYILDQQGNQASIEVAFAGYSSKVERVVFTEYAEVGAIWRLKSLHGYRS